MQTGFQKSWSRRNVPDDVWPEVLSHLPVKSLLRFRCVSRSWRALIDDPDFTRSHLTRLNNNRLQSHLFLVQGKLNIQECVVRCTKSFRITARLAFLQSDAQSIDTLRSSPGKSPDVNRWVVVSSIDGLFMLRNYTTLTPELMLWNPSCRKALILPPTPQMSSDRVCGVFGIGFDPLLKDYKYVTLIESVTGGMELVAIYTLGANSWKNIEFQGEGCLNWHQNLICPRLLESFCLRGVLYALVRPHYRSPLRLFSFDLSSEVFSSTGLPVEDDPCLRVPSRSQALTMTDDGCSLALFDLLKSEGSIWVMENLTADFKSLIWTKHYTFSTTIPQDETLCCSGKLLCLNRDCEVLLHWRFFDSCGRVTSYNLETGRERIIQILKVVVLESSSSRPYIESLVLY